MNEEHCPCGTYALTDSFAYGYVTVTGHHPDCPEYGSAKTGKNSTDVISGLMSRLAEVNREAGLLEAAIREHRDQRGDDRCWLDDRKLYGVLPDADTADLTLPPECEFLESCRRFWRRRQDTWKAVDPDRMTIAELEAEVRRLRVENVELRRSRPDGGR